MVVSSIDNLSVNRKSAIMDQPVDITLHMEYTKEPLSAAQKEFYGKKVRDQKSVKAKVDALFKNGGELLHYVDETCFSVQRNIPSPTPVDPSPRQGKVKVSANIPSAFVQKLSSPVILHQTPSESAVSIPPKDPVNRNGAYQLLVDPCVGLLVGSGQNTSNSTVQTTATLGMTSLSPESTSTKGILQNRGGSLHIQVKSNSSTNIQPAKTVLPIVTTSIANTPTRATNVRIKPKPSPGIAAAIIVPSTSSNLASVQNKLIPANVVPASNKSSASPTSVQYWQKQGLTPEEIEVTPVVDLTADDSIASQTSLERDSKATNRTFPSLVVIARPTIRTKDFSQTALQENRARLDQMMKTVLMLTPTKFTEWLLQQGLLRSEQLCVTHVDSSNKPINLKLGMYSDISKFPYSGGYVWISDCCPQRFVSVFNGSIFEGSPHPPSVLLKLIYHWTVQTNVHNVVQWVKVDNFYIKKFYTNMRAICSAAISEKYGKMGGLRKRVEVGVISLGTVSQSSKSRLVKVEVLGVMDPEKKFIRLRAVDPLQDGERNYKRRFVKLLEPLLDWVHKDSIIITDFTIDKGTLYNMGFNSVHQVSVIENTPQVNKYSNQEVMDYLRTVVPKIFQSTLSVLNRPIIQQFLDELVWRERWGYAPTTAFETITSHIAEQCRIDCADNFLARLNKITLNPFKIWTYKALGDPPFSSSGIMFIEKPVNSLLAQPTNMEYNRGNNKRGPKSAKNNSLLTKRRKRKGSDSPVLSPAIPTKKLIQEPVPEPVEDEPICKLEIEEEGFSEPPSIDDVAHLSEYYYSQLPGSKELIDKEFKSCTLTKCCACPQKFSNNIMLMKHLIAHTHAENQGAAKVTDFIMCRYCVKAFATTADMKLHVDEIHFKGKVGLICHICEEKFKDIEALQSHMNQNHVAWEMPYECGICKFRSSFHRDVIDHFYAIHNGGEKMQCPFCLKIVAFAIEGKRMSANVFFFLHHITQHQKKSFAKKCDKCALWFVQQANFNDHFGKDHNSFSSPDEDFKPSVPPPGVKKTLPILPPRSSLPQRTKDLSTSKETAMSKTLRQLRKDYTYLKCLECNENLLEDKHLLGQMRCVHCSFSTCCNKSVIEHSTTFHQNSKKTKVKLKNNRIIVLQTPLYCICGYQSKNGNLFTEHLISCNKKTAYATSFVDELQSASFPPLVTLDDVENASEDPSDRWLKAFVATRKEETDQSMDKLIEPQAKPKESEDPHSMLNVLGLVRKPSTDDSSLDRESSDNEGKSG